ncbi:Uncharacterised protein [Klebsiella pneumoniae]|nr:Uncharacterised protein [Klebsiella pneumoniae]SXH19318.1 Uncharacterised protein [Klebsiella pneumoniae]SXK09670.1 Uncharacterised protein [Klebsiella pneumoniae]SXK36803.1 Uncharacterised protein [Klebsiella pneumoniae]SXQ05072.1 Uncharacterised protein [Klebsiella pneumoniae]
MLLHPALFFGAKGKRGIEKRQIATVEPVLHDPHRGVAVDGMDKTVEELMQLWPIVTGDKAVVLLLLTKIVRDNQRLREIFRDAVASGDVVADKILILAADHRGESLIVAIIKGDFGVGKRLLNNIEKSAIAGAGQRDAAVSGQRRQRGFQRGDQRRPGFKQRRGLIQARGERIPVRHLSEQGIHLAVGQGGERLLLGVILADNHLQSEAVRHQRQIVGVNALITFLVAVIDDGRPLGKPGPDGQRRLRRQPCFLLTAKRDIDRRDMRMALQLQLFHGIRGRREAQRQPDNDG